MSEEIVTTRAVTWDDIGYLVAVEVHSHYMELDTYQIVDRDKEGLPIFNRKGWSSTDPVFSLHEAQIFLSGTIKWDGCSNLKFDDQDNAMLHFCGKQYATEVGVLLGRLYDLAKELIPAWQGD